MAGFALSVVAILVALSYLVWYLIDPGQFPRGFASLIISIWFFAGIQLFCLGVVGEYVLRTCEEGRKRPVALVREVVRHGNPSEPERPDGVACDRQHNNSRTTP